MDGLTLALAALSAALIILLFMYIKNARRVRRLSRQMEDFLVSGGRPLPFSVREDALAPLQNAAAELENRVMLTQAQKQEEKRATRDLTADISHQLKTPLAALRLFCEMDESAHAKEQMTQIERMEGLIQSLLRLERLCADGYPFTFAEHDAAAIIHEAWLPLAAVYPDKTLDISGDATLRCDRAWLCEAFGNLLKNACEHTPTGGRIAVRLEASDSAFFCTLTDNGGGVDASALPRLFDRFYRAKGDAAKGAGIGLSIVKEIIRRHHGSVYAQNAQGGLRIVMTLPILNLAKT